MELFSILVAVLVTAIVVTACAIFFVSMRAMIITDTERRHAIIAMKKEIVKACIKREITRAEKEAMLGMLEKLMRDENN